MSVKPSHVPHGFTQPFCPEKDLPDESGKHAFRRACLLKHNPPGLCPNPLLIPRKKELPDGTVFGTRAPIRCNSWTCPSCRIVKMKYLYAMITKHCPVKEFHFLTLTLRLKRKVTRDDWFRLTHCWEIFLKRIKRKKDGIKFFRAVELTKKNMPHIHVLINFTMSEHRTHDIWHEITGDSFIARFEPIRENVAAYILKYLDKGIESAKNIRELTGNRTRIFTTSRGLFYIRPKVKEYELIDFASTVRESANILQSEYDSRFRMMIVKGSEKVEFRNNIIWSFEYKLKKECLDTTPRQPINFSVLPPIVRTPIQYRLPW